ncbi:MAG: DUF3696 domain-containing protein [Chloroflexi bacterium]|nr:DUF3696 domain-containing protein [Chloroflexota bacterium]
MRLENFKPWESTGDVTLKPITGFFGSNSSGKSSLIQSLLLMKQTVDAPDQGIVFHFGDENTLVDLGDFDSVIHEHDTTRALKISLKWKSKERIRVPDVYKGGFVSEGEEIGFSVEVRENTIDSKRSLLLEEMEYQLADSRSFGMKKKDGEFAYRVYERGKNLDLAESTWTPDRYSRQSKFCEFPYQAEDLFADRSFIFGLRYELTRQLQDLRYVGPFRIYPRRIYQWSGAQPSGVGSGGEFAIESMLSTRDGNFERLGEAHLTVEKYVAQWLKRLGIVHDFQVEPLGEGKRLFEVKVRKTSSSPEVFLTDIGFGVSQILPVLVQCFFVREGSTVILEQPDIHLHPSTQAELADVFIDAWNERRTQILFESHSEHLLRRLQRRIAEGEIDQERVRLYFCSTDGDGTSNLSELELDKFGNISNWPEDFFGDQFGEMAAMSNAAIKRQGLAH